MFIAAIKGAGLKSGATVLVSPLLKSAPSTFITDFRTLTKKLVKTPNEKKRLQRIIDGIWQNTLEGQREHELRNVQPPRSLGVVQQQEAGGNPANIEWDHATTADNWVGLSNEKSENGCSMNIAADSQYLYLKFHDPSIRKNESVSIWSDGLELFFTDDGKYPVYQLAFSPRGKQEFYRYQVHDNSLKTEEYDPGVKAISQSDTDGWTLLLSLPLKNLPLRNSVLRANFMRSTASGNFCWTPIYLDSYIWGIDRAGAIYFFPVTIQKTGFACFKRGENSDMVSDDQASDGRAAVMDGNAGWSLSYHLRDNFPPGKYRILVRARSEAPPEAELSHNLGVHDPVSDKTIAYKKILVRDIAGKDYKTLDLGEFELKPRYLFFVGGLNKEIPVNRIYINWLYFEKIK